MAESVNPASVDMKELDIKPVSTVNCGTAGTLEIDVTDYYQENTTFELVLDGKKYTAKVKDGKITFNFAKMPTAGDAAAKLYAINEDKTTTDVGDVTFQIYEAAPKLTNAMDFRQTANSLILSWAPAEGENVVYEVEINGEKYETTLYEEYLEISDIWKSFKVGDKVTAKVTAYYDVDGMASNVISTTLTVCNYDTIAPTAPSSNCEIDSSTVNNGGEGKLVLTPPFTDGESGIARYELVLHGKVYTVKAADVAEDGTITFTLPKMSRPGIYENIPENTYAARLYAVDVAGNCSDALSVYVPVYRTVPAITGTPDFRLESDGTVYLSWAQITNADSDLIYCVKIYDQNGTFEHTDTTENLSYWSGRLDSVPEGAKLTAEVCACYPDPNSPFLSNTVTTQTPLDYKDIAPKKVDSDPPSLNNSWIGDDCECTANNLKEGKLIVNIDGVFSGDNIEKYELVVNGKKYTAESVRDGKAVFALPKMAASNDDTTFTTGLIYAVDAFGMSSAPATVEFTVQKGIPDIAAETDFRQTANGKLELSWQPLSNAEGLCYVVKIYNENNEILCIDKEVYENYWSGFVGSEDGAKIRAEIYAFNMNNDTENNTDYQADSPHFSNIVTSGVLEYKHVTPPAEEAGTPPKLNADYAGGIVAVRSTVNLLRDGEIELSVSDVFYDREDDIVKYELVIDGVTYQLSRNDKGNLVCKVPPMNVDTANYSISTQLYAIDAAGNNSAPVGVSFTIYDTVPNISSLDCRQTADGMLALKWNPVQEDYGDVRYSVTVSTADGNSFDLETTDAYMNIDCSEYGIGDGAELKIEVSASYYYYGPSGWSIPSETITGSVTYSEIVQEELTSAPPQRNSSAEIYSENIVSTLNAVKAGNLTIDINGIFEGEISEYQLVVRGEVYTAKDNGDGTITFSDVPPIAGNGDMRMSLYAVNASGNSAEVPVYVPVSGGIPVMPEGASLDFRQTNSGVICSWTPVALEGCSEGVAPNIIYVLQINEEGSDNTKEYSFDDSWGNKHTEWESFGFSDGKKYIAKIYAVNDLGFKTEILSGEITYRTFPEEGSEEISYPSFSNNTVYVSISAEEGLVHCLIENLEEQVIDTSVYRLVINGKEYLAHENIATGTDHEGNVYSAIEFSIPSSEAKNPDTTLIQQVDLYRIDQNGVSIVEMNDISILKLTEKTVDFSNIVIRQVSNGILIDASALELYEGGLCAEITDANGNIVADMPRINGTGQNTLLFNENFTPGELTLRIYGNDDGMLKTEKTFTAVENIDFGDVRASETTGCSVNNSRSGEMVFSLISGELAESSSLELEIDGVPYTEYKIDGNIITFTVPPMINDTNYEQPRYNLWMVKDGVRALLAEGGISVFDIRPPVMTGDIDFRRTVSVDSGNELFAISWAPAQDDNTIYLYYTVEIYATVNGREVLIAYCGGGGTGQVGGYFNYYMNETQCTWNPVDQATYESLIPENATKLTAKVYAEQRGGITGDEVWRSETVSAVIELMELGIDGLEITGCESALSNAKDGTLTFLGTFPQDSEYQIVINGKSYSGTLEDTGLVFELPAMESDGYLAYELYAVKDGISTPLTDQAVTIADDMVKPAPQIDVRYTSNGIVLNVAKSELGYGDAGMQMNVIVEIEGEDWSCVETWASSPITYYGNSKDFTVKVYRSSPADMTSNAELLGEYRLEAVTDTPENVAQITSVSSDIDNVKGGTVSFVFDESYTPDENSKFEMVLDGKVYKDYVIADGCITFTVSDIFPVWEDEMATTQATYSPVLYQVMDNGVSVNILELELNYVDSSFSVKDVVAPKMADVLDFRKTVNEYGNTVFYLNWAEAEEESAFKYVVEIYDENNTLLASSDPSNFSAHSSIIYDNPTPENTSCVWEPAPGILENVTKVTAKVYAVQTIDAGSGDPADWVPVSEAAVREIVLVNEDDNTDIVPEIDTCVVSSSISTDKDGGSITFGRDIPEVESAHYELVCNSRTYTGEFNDRELVFSGLPAMEKGGYLDYTLYFVSANGFSTRIEFSNPEDGEVIVQTGESFDFRQTGSSSFIIDISNLSPDVTYYVTLLNDYGVEVDNSITQEFYPGNISSGLLTLELAENAFPGVQTNDHIIAKIWREDTGEEFFAELDVCEYTAQTDDQQTLSLAENNINNAGKGSVVFYVNEGKVSAGTYELVIEGKVYKTTLAEASDTLKFTVDPMDYVGESSGLSAVLYKVEDGISSVVYLAVPTTGGLTVNDLVAPVMSNDIDFRKTPSAYRLSWAPAQDDSNVSYVVEIYGTINGAEVLLASSQGGEFVETITDVYGTSCTWTPMYMESADQATRLTAKIYAVQGYDSANPSENMLYSEAVTAVIKIADSGVEGLDITGSTSTLSYTKGSGTLTFTGTFPKDQGTYELVLNGTKYTGTVNSNGLEFKNLPKIEADGHTPEYRLYLVKDGVSTLISDNTQLTLPVEGNMLSGAMDLRQTGTNTFTLDLSGLTGFGFGEYQDGMGDMVDTTTTSYIVKLLDETGKVISTSEVNFESYSSSLSVELRLEDGQPENVTAQIWKVTKDEYYTQQVTEQVLMATSDTVSVKTFAEGEAPACPEELCLECDDSTVNNVSSGKVVFCNYDSATWEELPIPDGTYYLVLDGVAIKGTVSEDTLTFSNIPKMDSYAYATIYREIDGISFCVFSDYIMREDRIAPVMNGSLDFRRNSDGNFDLEWTIAEDDNMAFNYVLEIFGKVNGKDVLLASTDCRYEPDSGEDSDAGVEFIELACDENYITAYTTTYTWKPKTDTLRNVTQLTAKIYACTWYDGPMTSKTLSSTIEVEIVPNMEISCSSNHTVNNVSAGQVVFTDATQISGGKYEMVVDGKKYTGTFNKDGELVFKLPKMACRQEPLNYKVYFVYKDGRSVELTTNGQVYVYDMEAPKLSGSLDFRQAVVDGEDVLLLDWPEVSGENIKYTLEIYAPGVKEPIYKEIYSHGKDAASITFEDIKDYCDYEDIAYPADMKSLTAKVYAKKTDKYNEYNEYSEYNESPESAKLSATLTIRDFERPTVAASTSENTVVGSNITSTKAGTVTIDVNGLFTDNVGIKTYELVVNGKKYSVQANKADENGNITFSLPKMDKENADDGTVSGKLYAIDAAGNYSNEGISVSIPVTDGVPKMSGTVDVRQTVEDTFCVSWAEATTSEEVRYIVELYAPGVKEAIYKTPEAEKISGTSWSFSRKNAAMPEDVDMSEGVDIPEGVDKLTVKVYAVQTGKDGSYGNEVLSNVLSSTLTLTDDDRPEASVEEVSAEQIQSSANTAEKGTLVVDISTLFTDNDGIETYELVLNGNKYSVKAEKAEDGKITFNLPKMAAETASGNNGKLYAIDYAGNCSKGIDITVPVNNGALAKPASVDLRQVGSNTFVLEWALPDDATGYKLEVLNGKESVHYESEHTDNNKCTITIYDEDLPKNLTVKLYATTGNKNAPVYLESAPVSVTLKTVEYDEYDMLSFYSYNIVSDVNNSKGGKVTICTYDASPDYQYELVVNGKKYTASVSKDKNEYELTFSLPKTERTMGEDNNTLHGTLYAVKDGVSYVVQDLDINIAVHDYVKPTITKVDFRQTDSGFDIDWVAGDESSDVLYYVDIYKGSERLVTLGGVSTPDVIDWSVLPELATGDKIKATVRAVQVTYDEGFNAEETTFTASKTSAVITVKEAAEFDSSSYSGECTADLNNNAKGTITFEGIDEEAGSYELLLDGTVYTGGKIVEGNLVFSAKLPITDAGETLEGKLYYKDANGVYHLVEDNVTLTSKDKKVPTISSLNVRQIDDEIYIDWGKTSSDVETVEYTVKVSVTVGKETFTLEKSCDTSDCVLNTKEIAEECPEGIDPAEWKAAFTSASSYKITVTAVKGDIVSKALTATHKLPVAAGEISTGAELAEDTELSNSAVTKVTFSNLESNAKYELVINGKTYKASTGKTATSVTFSLPKTDYTTEDIAYTLYQVQDGISYQISEGEFSVADKVAPKMGTVSVRQTGVDTIVLDWTEATDVGSGVESYYAKIKVGSTYLKNDDGGDKYTLEGAGTALEVLAGTKKGTTVSVEVYAVDDDGNVSAAGKASLKYTDQIPEEAPATTGIKVSENSVYSNDKAVSVVFERVDTSATYELVFNGKKYTGKLNKNDKTVSFNLGKLAAGTAVCGTLYAVKGGISYEVDFKREDDSVESASVIESESNVWFEVTDATAPKFSITNLDFRQTANGFCLDWAQATDETAEALSYRVEIYNPTTKETLVFNCGTDSEFAIQVEDGVIVDDNGETWTVDDIAKLTAKVYAVDGNCNDSAKPITSTLTLKANGGVLSGEDAQVAIVDNGLNNAAAGKVVFSIGEANVNDKYELVIDGKKYAGTVDKKKCLVTFSLPKTAYSETGITATLYKIVDGRSVAVDNAANDITDGKVSLAVADKVKPTLANSLDFRQSGSNLILDWADAVDADSAVTYTLEIYSGKELVYKEAGLADSEKELDFDQLNATKNITSLSAKVYAVQVQEDGKEDVTSSTISSSAVKLNPITLDVTEESFAFDWAGASDADTKYLVELTIGEETTTSVANSSEITLEDLDFGDATGANLNIYTYTWQDKNGNNACDVFELTKTGSYISTAFTKDGKLA